MPGFIADDTPVGLRLERMLQKACGVLGVSRYATKTDVKTAYLEYVKRNHPDSMDEAIKHGTPDLPHTLEEVRKAKDLLYQHLQTRA